MLKKMLIHGLIAATVIGGAAAVYASGRGDGYEMDVAAPVARVESAKVEGANNGYIADRSGHSDHNRYFWQERDDDHERDHYGERSERHREHRDRDDD
jgi:hypothetical protein